MDAKNLSDRFNLTAREADIVALVARGYGNADIGSRLGITEKTVKNILTSVPLKMGIGADDRGGSLRVRVALTAHGIPFGE